MKGSWLLKLAFIFCLINYHPALRAQSLAEDVAQSLEQLSQSEPVNILAINFWEQDKEARVLKMAQSLKPQIPQVILGSEVSPRQGSETTAHKLAKLLGLNCVTHQELAVLSIYPIQKVYRYKLSHSIILDRYLIVADLKTPKGIWRAAAVHFAHEQHESDRPEDIRHGAVRAKQLAEVAAILANLRATQPVALEILGGDFNMLPFEMEKGRQQYLANWYDGNETQFSTWRLIRNNVLYPENQRLDYIYLNPLKGKIEFILEERLWGQPVSGVYLSDHLGLRHQAFLVEP